MQAMSWFQLLLGVAWVTGLGLFPGHGKALPSHQDEDGQFWAVPQLTELPEGEKDNAWMFGDLIGEDGDGTFDLWEDLPVLGEGDHLWRAPRPQYRVPPQKIKDYEARPLQIRVHKSIQERGYQYLTVHYLGELKFLAPISTAWERLAKAKRGTYYAVTPHGIFAPDAIEPKRFSNRWQVMLSYVIRFNSGIWIHATTPDHYHELGFPASGGCVRLHLEDAKVVYDWVKQVGLQQTVIMVYPHNQGELQIPRHLQKNPPPLPQDFIEWRVSRGIKVTEKK